MRRRVFFPDFPAEIRAPQGTVPGVSGFQVHIGTTEINTPGDIAERVIPMTLGFCILLYSHLIKVENIIFCFINLY